MENNNRTSEHSFRKSLQQRQLHDCHINDFQIYISLIKLFTTNKTTKQCVIHVYVMLCKAKMLLVGYANIVLVCFIQIFIGLNSCFYRN